MKLKKVLSGFVSAAILATSTAFVMPLSASAAETTNVTVLNNATVTAWGNTEVDLTSKGTPVSNATITISINDASIYNADNNVIFNIIDQDWANPVVSASFTDGTETPTSFTYSIADELNGITSFKLQGGHKDNIYSITVSEVEAPAFEGSALTLNKNEPYNWQGTDSLSTSEITASNFDELLKTVKGVEVSFVVNGASSGNSNDFDVSKINYQIQVNGNGTGNYYPWIVGGSSSYNASTKTATVTFNDLADVVSAQLDKDSKEPADVNFTGLNLIAMTDMENATDPVKLFHEDYDIVVSATTAVESVTLDQTTLALELSNENKKEATLVATVKPDDATDKTVTWKSSDTKVATVDTTGKVTAVASGTATITATSTADETKKAECEVTVTNPATAIAIGETASVLVGGTKTLAVTTTPADADELTYTWASSDTAVATVADGVVTGVKAGTAKITVTAGTLKAECTVTVTADEVPATKVELDKTTLTLEEEDTATLKATVTPADSTDKITWSSDNEKVATVDANGKVTAVAEGKANIIATANAEQKAECAVTVTAKKVEEPTPSGNALWEGSTETGNWAAYAEIKAEKFADITAPGKLVVTIADAKEGAQYGLRYVADEWTNILLDNGKDYSEAMKAGTTSFEVPVDAALLANLKKYNLIVAGHDYTIKKVEYVAEATAESSYDKLTVVDVDDYVPATKGTKLTVMSITEEDAKTAKSYTVTIKASNGKSYTYETNDCYKGFKYSTANGDKTEKAKGYFIVVKVNNVPDDVTLDVTITANK